MSNADVSDEEVVALMDALGGNATITDLDISCNGLGSTGEEEVNLNQWQSQASLLAIVEEEGGLIGGPAIAAALSTNQVSGLFVKSMYGCIDRLEWLYPPFLHVTPPPHPTPPPFI